MLPTPMLLEKKNVLFKNQLMPLHPLKLCNQKYQNDIILTSSMSIQRQSDIGLTHMMLI